MNKILHRFSSARREQVLLDFAEQRLDPRQHARVARHLERCARCREQFDEHQAYLAYHRQRQTAPYDRASSQSPSHSLPPGLSDRLHRQIQAISSAQPVHPAKSGRSELSRPVWTALVNRPVIAAAALLVLLAVAGLLNLNTGRSSQAVIPEWGQAMDSAGVQDNATAAAKMDNGGGQSQALEDQRAQSDAAPAAVPGPSGETEAAAGVMMMAEASPAVWQDVLTSDWILPFQLADQPESPVFARELAGDGALAAVWLESGHLLIAYPQEQAETALARIKKRLEDSQPAAEVTLQSSESFAEWLSRIVPSADSPSIRDHLGLYETMILVITIGGN
jgi:hypothetical protein